MDITASSSSETANWKANDDGEEHVDNDGLEFKRPKNDAVLTMPTATSMMQLPTEILLSCFNTLSTYELNSLRQSSKRLRNVIDDKLGVYYNRRPLALDVQLISDEKYSILWDQTIKLKVILRFDSKTCTDIQVNGWHPQFPSMPELVRTTFVGTTFDNFMRIIIRSVPIEHVALKGNISARVLTTLCDFPEAGVGSFRIMGIVLTDARLLTLTRRTDLKELCIRTEGPTLEAAREAVQILLSSNMICSYCLEDDPITDEYKKC